MHLSVMILGFPCFLLFFYSSQILCLHHPLACNDTAPLTRYHACIYGVVCEGGEQRNIMLSYTEFNARKVSSGGYRSAVSNAIPRVAEGYLEGG